VTWADIGKITKELDWQPRVTFERGVANIVANIDYWRNAPLWNPDSIEDATKTWFQFMAPEKKI
jgi:UDP-glucose 4-epimerase